MVKKIITVLIIIIVLILVWVLFLRGSPPEQNISNEINEEESQRISEDSSESAINRLSEIGESLSANNVSQHIVGSWQSLDNNDYRVVFGSNGEMSESLGETSNSAGWKLVSYDEGPNTVVGTVSFSRDGVFLEQSLDEGKSKFYYKVVQADESSLVLIYLHQGGVLTFKRAL